MGGAALVGRHGTGPVEDRPVEDRQGRTPAPPAAPRAALETRTGRERPPSADTPFSKSLFARCPELECVRGLVSEAVLALAAWRSETIGVGAERVLIADGDLDEQTYVEVLAGWLDVAFEPLDSRRRSECPLPDARLIEAATTGMLPLAPPEGTIITVAPVLAGSRRLLKAAGPGSDLRRRIRLTTTPRLQRFVTSRAAAWIGRRAAAGLHDARPDLSAAATAGTMSWRSACAGLAALTAFLLAPAAAWSAVEAALASVFLCWAGLRLIGMLSIPLAARRRRPYADRDLPVYTIIVALHREAAAVPGLIAALSGLRYPREKLDIKLALEPDDEATIAAVRALRLVPPFEIVLAPQAGPKTKPKALNAALLFARGDFVAVYDAEDRPEPDQLRRALDAFSAGDERLACVQARLTIDNTADTWLTRLFTAEYAGLFDVLLPGLAHWRLPLPLGGSSNHFRTSALRAAGGWDAFNVTEDADLGMRLARFGYGTSVIPSTTYEEAPARLRPWLYQRTRWFKGWMRLVNSLEISINYKYLHESSIIEMAALATISQRRPVEE